MPVRVHRPSLALAALVLASGCHPGEPRSAPSVPVTTAAAQVPAAQVPADPAPPDGASRAPLAVAPPVDAPAVPAGDMSAVPASDAPASDTSIASAVPAGDRSAAPASDAPASEVPAAPARLLKPLKKIASWPFVAWDRAEALTFNHVAYGPGVPLRAYDEANGWSPKIVERKPITPQQGARAVRWVIATRGEIEVSKCAFPRHAVVLYAGDTPVGTANVCFECGDILVWPDLEPRPDYDRWSDAKQKQQDRKYRQQMTAYKQVFPQWERFFRDELGFSLTPPRGAVGGL